MINKIKMTSHNFIFLFSTSVLISCSSIKAPSFLNRVQPEQEFLVRNMGAIQLGLDWQGELLRDDRVEQYDKTRDYPLRGRDAVGAPIQSFIAPQPVSSNRILLALLGEGIQLRDTLSGATIWKQVKRIGSASKPLLTDSHVYAAFMNAEVSKYDLDTGKEIWTQKLNVESTGGIASGQGLIFLTTADNAVWALDEKTGAPLWTYRRPAPNNSVYWSLRSSSTPIVSLDASRIYVGFSDGTAVALESLSGEVVWERALAPRNSLLQDFDLGPVLSSDGRFLYIAQVDGDLYSLNSLDGSIVWRRPLEVSGVPTYDSTNNMIYVSSLKGDIYSVSAQDGQIVWSHSRPQSGLASRIVLMNKGHLIVTWTKGPLTLHSSENGNEVWKSQESLRSLAPAYTDGSRIFIVSTRNELHRYVVQGLGD